MAIDISQEQSSSETAYGALFFSRPPFRSLAFVGMTISCVLCLALVMLIFIRYQKPFLQLFFLLPALLFIVTNVPGTWWKVWGYLDRLRELRKNVTEAPRKADFDTALGISAKIATDCLFFCFNVIALLLVLIFFSLKFVNRK
jgi:hypothetical protein